MMGQLLTKIYKRSAREVNMYNIEKRAEKVISKEKPTPAPMYPSTIKELDRLKKENVSKEYLQRKDELLDENLKKVYVSTSNQNVSNLNNKDENVTGDHRPLPLKRYSEDQSLYGYSESEENSIPVGRVSLKQALQLVADHRRDPQNHSNTTIAAQYRLPITLTDDILEHFKLFDVHIKRTETDPEKLSAYEKLENKVRNMTVMNAGDILKEFPHFKKKPFKMGLSKLEDKEKDNVNIADTSSDNLNSDKKK